MKNNPETKWIERLVGVLLDNQEVKIFLESKIFNKEKSFSESLLNPSVHEWVESPYIRYSNIVDTLKCNPWLLSRTNMLFSLDADGIEEIISLMSQWDELLKIWDRLADFALDKDLGIDRPMLEVLELSMSLINKRFDDPPLAFFEPEPGVRIDRKICNPANISGDFVGEVILPGIRGADGKIIRSALVISS